MSRAPPNLEVRGALDSCRKARRYSVLGCLSAVRRYRHLDSITAVKYHPPMIYYMAAIASLGPIIGVLMAWILVRHALRSFQNTVTDAIGSGIAKQDDRIRKGRERDGQRTPVGRSQADSELGQLATMLAGQPVPDRYSQE